LREVTSRADFARTEFRALRDAIARRTQLKAVLFLAGLGAWAAALLACLAAVPYPLVSVVPLALLLATYEAIRPLHFGAERIGRYLQAFHEEGDSLFEGPVTPPAWEWSAMAFGPGLPGAAGHPLFGPVFAVAALLNMLAVLLPGPVPVELALLAVPHAAFLGWLAYTDRVMRAQRTAELARFRALRDTVIALKSDTADSKDATDTTGTKTTRSSQF
jgi:hypothetical protein